jgi:hypothetical protein
MKTYGEQRFRQDMRELTPEEQAMQTLEIEAIKEKARYERGKRQKLVKKTKETGSFLIKLAILTIVSLILAFVIGCEKPKEECYVYDLGVAGEFYRTVPTNGVPSVIYVDGGRIKQEICPF